MNNNTHALNSALLNALMELTETNKEAVTTAFRNSMSHMDCDHEVCQNVGKDMADMVEAEDWQELSNFLDHGHLDY